jgi:hypothetical protein
MTKKKLTQKQAINRLTNKLNYKYTKEQQDYLEFYPDEETDHQYSWIFMDGDKRVEWCCNLHSGEISEVEGV